MKKEEKVTCDDKQKESVTDYLVFGIIYLLLCHYQSDLFDLEREREEEREEKESNVVNYFLLACWWMFVVPNSMLATPHKAPPLVCRGPSQKERVPSQKAAHLPHALLAWQAGALLIFVALIHALSLSN